MKFFRSSKLSLKLNQNEVLVPDSLALLFDIVLSGGHANNFLVQTVMRALVDKLVLTFAGIVFQDTVDKASTKSLTIFSFSRKSEMA